MPDQSPSNRAPVSHMGSVHTEYLLGGAVTGTHLRDIAEIPLTDLHIDVVYQRPINERKVISIAERFEPASAGALAVSKREDGRYFIMDGQHRFRAMQRLGHNTALCLIYEGLTIQEEATIFVECNTVRATPPAIVVYMARLTAGDPVALKIARVLQEMDIRVPTRHHRGYKLETNPRTLFAINAMDDLYKRGGIEEVKYILTLALDMWPESPQALNAVTLRSLSIMHITYTRAGLWPSDFAQRVSLEPIERIIRLARNYSDFHGGSVYLNTIRAYVNIYNKRKQKKLPSLIGESAHTEDGSFSGYTIETAVQNPVEGVPSETPDETE